MEQQLDEISRRAGDGSAVIPVVPAVQQAMLGPRVPITGGRRGDSHFWLTYIGSPADGSIDSPRADWADEIVARFRPA